MNPLRGFREIKAEWLLHGCQLQNKERAEQLANVLLNNLTGFPSTMLFQIFYIEKMYFLERHKTENVEHFFGRKRQVSFITKTPAPRPDLEEKRQKRQKGLRKHGKFFCVDLLAVLHVINQCCQPSEPYSRFVLNIKQIYSMQTKKSLETLNIVYLHMGINYIDEPIKKRILQLYNCSK